MDLKGAEIRNVKNLCSKMGAGSNEIRSMMVTIPYYQRPYKWGEEHIEKLINDFQKNKKEKYFVGSAVMVQSDNGKHDVIDGQQRITTMFLLAYLKFLLQRAYTEEVIQTRKVVKIETSLENLAKSAGLVFGKTLEEKLEDVCKSITRKLETDDEKDELYEEILKEYQDAVGLPQKDLSNPEEYFNKYLEHTKKLFSNSDLAISYKRESYNKKLKEALSNCAIIMTDSTLPQLNKITEKEDDLVSQYLNALEYEFIHISKNVSNDGKTSITYTADVIEEIESMLNNVDFCVIITGEEKDAYTLFEVLNDRALEIEDLDLIKNLFYKWYCNHTSDDDNSIDECIEEVDKIWVENIFPPETGKERAKLISYFAATYFTADKSLKYNDNERYRELLESKYLSRLSTYSSNNIKNDINIYYMISLLLKEYRVAFTKKNEMCLEAAKKQSNSITYKTVHLLNALKQNGVLAALVNVIIKKYVDNNVDSDGIIDTSNFVTYIQDIAGDAAYTEEKFSDIHKIAFSLWKNSLLCSGAELPREEAKEIIGKNNVNHYDTNYQPKSEVVEKMIKNFGEWIDNWRYNKSDNNIRAKILLIDLFQTDKQNNKLMKLPTARTIKAKVELELDHMEADNPNDAMIEKYFEPKTPGDLRENYTNSIGNFMILDREDNNNKNNQPLEYALRYYEAMAPKHWLINEVRTMMQDNQFFEKKGNGSDVYHIPTEKFFIERRDRLKRYLVAMLTSNLNEDEIDIK